MNERQEALLQRAINVFGEEAQQKMTIEEMAELQKAICKLWRGLDNYKDLAEEIADVKIMLEQLEIMFDLQPCVHYWMERKLERLKARLDVMDMNRE